MNLICILCSFAVTSLPPQTQRVDVSLEFVYSSMLRCIPRPTVQGNVLLTELAAVDPLYTRTLHSSMENIISSLISRIPGEQTDSLSVTLAATGNTSLTFRAKVSMTSSASAFQLEQLATAAITSGNFRFQLGTSVESTECGSARVKLADPLLRPARSKFALMRLLIWINLFCCFDCSSRLFLRGLCVRVCVCVCVCVCVY